MVLICINGKQEEEEEEKESGCECSGVYPRQPNLTNPLSQSLLLTVASVGAGRGREEMETCETRWGEHFTLVMQRLKAFWLLERLVASEGSVSED